MIMSNKLWDKIPLKSRFELNKAHQLTLDDCD